MKCSPASPGEMEATGTSRWRQSLAGLSWTSPDIIENLRRSDQAHSDGADATRTERGFQASGHGVSAGQGAFRWAGMGSL